MMMLARDTSFLVLDFETTGSVPGFPVEPWQIGAVRLEQGEIAPKPVIDTLLRVAPDRPFNRNAPGRHALLRDEIAQAPTLQDRWTTLFPLLRGTPLVAHNIGTERTILTRTAPLHRFGPWIDTLRLTRLVYPTLPSKALDAVCEMLHLTSKIDALCPGRAAHDALYDAFACAVLLQHLLSLPAWNGISLEALHTGY